MNKLLKWVLASVGVGVVLFVLAAVILPMTADPNNYKEEIRATVLEQTGRELHIGGDIQWSVFPWIGLDLSDVKLGNRSGFGDRPMLVIGGAGVSVKLLPLFRRKIEIGKLSLDDVSVYLQQKANGQNNWEDLSGPQTNSSTTVSTEVGDIGALIVSAIEISRANVTWDDAGNMTELKDFALKANHIELGQPFDLEGSFSVNVTQSQLVGEAMFGGLVKTAANGSRYEVEGFNFSFEGKKGAAPEVLSLDVAIDANLDIDLEEDQAALTDFVLQFNGLSITGEFNLTSLSSEPRVAFDFQADSLNLDELLPETEAEADDSELSVDIFRGFNGGGDVRIGELVVAGLTATDVSLKISGDGEGVRVFSIKAQFYGGQHKGDVNIDASGKRPWLTTSQQLTAVRAEGLLQDLTGSARLEGVGDLSLEIRTDLSNSSSMRQALSGDIAMSFLDGAIVGIDVAETIRTAKTALGRSTKAVAEPGQKPKTDFSELTMTGTIEQGIFTSSDLMMRSPLLRVTGKGSVNLVNETINYLVKPTLVGSLEGQGSQDLDELNGIPIPVKLTGNLYEPDIAIDIAAAIAGTQKEKIEEKKDELIGKLLGEKEDPDAVGEEKDGSEKDDPAKSLIKGIFGKKMDSSKK